MKKIYLDYAAATPLDKRVLAAIQPYLTTNFYNPSALYEPARRVRQAVEAARSQVAQVLGAKPSEVVFTAGATESINLAFRTDLKPKSEIIISTIEHEAVMAAAQATGHQVIICPVLPSGLLDLEQLKKLLNQNTAMVSIGYANNEIGVIQPLAKIAKLIKYINPDTLFHSDASQAANYLDLHVNRLGVDLLTLNGGKIYGPKQSGCLYVRSGLKLQPLIYGGGQEKGLRSGTENVAGIVGFGLALELAAAERGDETSRLTKLRDQTITEVTVAIQGCGQNGDATRRLPNNLNLSIDGVNGESLVHHLDHRGVLVATGAACSANKDTPSIVLRAIGLNLNQVNSSLRVTMGRQTTPAGIKYFIKQLVESVGQLRAQSL